MSADNNCQTKIQYVYHLPFFEREKLCESLDQNEKWIELAANWMKFDDLTINSLRREERPTDKLLNLWGNLHNHTILELFFLLSKMRSYDSMLPLKDLVDPKYLVLLEKCRTQEKELQSRSRQKGEEFEQKIKSLRIGMQCYDKVEQISKDDRRVIPHRSIHDTAEKILNKTPRETDNFLTSNSDNMLAPSASRNNLSPLSRRPATNDSKNKNNNNNHNNNRATGSSEDTALPKISYQELAEATNYWSSYTVLGKGGFGTVFLGKWKNTQVAIKRIEPRGPASNESYLIQLEQSLRELKILNAYRHDNILSLYAYSMGGDAPCLVYQFMSNGSLEDRIFLKQKTKPLNWIQRHEIARGTARGLQFLHTIGNKPLIHGDIKSANILLDKNFEPKIGDFGLAREGPEKAYMKVSRVQGTRPYLPDEFLLGRNLSTKIDTYSYGIVLLELATGLGAYSESRVENKFLKDFVDSKEGRDLFSLKDDKAGPENQQVFQNFIILGKWCSNKLSKDRPEMVSVLCKLDEL